MNEDNDISWPTVVAAIVLTVAAVAAGYGAGAENWYVIAGAGVLALVGIGLTLMSWREDR